jgi:glycosyltransferase involved in cell wall biosynthesis
MTIVGLITTFPSAETPVGGVATYAKSLVGALQEEACPSVIVFGQRHPPPEDPSTVSAWEFGWSFQESLRRSLDKHAVDLVHAQYEPFLFGSGAAALPALRLPHVIRRRGLPCLVTLHAVPFPSLILDSKRATSGIRRFATVYLRAIRWMGRAVDRFVVHESEQAESLKRFARIPEHAIAVVPHGVDVAERASRSPGEHPFTIGTFGFLTPYKDPDFLLEEFRELRRMLPEARLRFSLSPHPRRRGWRSDRRYRDTLRRARSIQGVETLQHIPEGDLPAFLADIDLVVLPYRYAVSASGVAAKAIGAGVPILVPEGSGTASHLDGWSFRYGPGGLAEALARQSGRLDQMHQQVCLLARECSWQRVAGLHRLLYA